VTKAHWRRHTISGGHVYSLVIMARGERWCAKLVPAESILGPASVCTFWRGTTGVGVQHGATKKTARELLEAKIELAAPVEAEEAGT